MNRKINKIAVRALQFLQIDYKLHFNYFTSHNLIVKVQVD